MSFIRKYWHRFLYKEKTKEIYWEKVISVSIFVVGLLFFSVRGIYKAQKDRKALEINHLYTIAITDGYEFGGIRQSSKTYFHFWYNGIRYDRRDGGASFNTEFKKKGGRYYVKFQPDNPENCLLLLECEVPDSIYRGNVYRKIPCEELSYFFAK